MGPPLLLQAFLKGGSMLMHLALWCAAALGAAAPPDVCAEFDAHCADDAAGLCGALAPLCAGAVEREVELPVFVDGREILFRVGVDADAEAFLWSIADALPQRGEGCENAACVVRRLAAPLAERQAAARERARRKVWGSAARKAAERAAFLETFHRAAAGAVDANLTSAVDDAAARALKARAADKDVLVARAGGIATVVETGYHRGLGAAFFVEHFDHVYSVELDPLLHADCETRFAPRVACVLGSSGAALRELLAGGGLPDGPVAFFLDAHYSFGDTAIAHGAPETPVIEELEAIFATWAAPVDDRRRSVVVVDDAREFKGFDACAADAELGCYPSLADLALLVDAWLARSPLAPSFAVVGDSFVITLDDRPPGT